MYNIESRDTLLITLMVFILTSVSGKKPTRRSTRAVSKVEASGGTRAKRRKEQGMGRSDGRYGGR